MADSELNQKFRKGPTYTQDMLIRDLIDVITALNVKIAELKARIDAAGIP